MGCGGSIYPTSVLLAAFAVSRLTLVHLANRATSASHPSNAAPTPAKSAGNAPLSAGSIKLRTPIPALSRLGFARTGLPFSMKTYASSGATGASLRLCMYVSRCDDAMAGR